MQLEKRSVAVCLTALLIFPLAVLGDDHGSDGGSGGGAVWEGSHGDDADGEGQNGVNPNVNPNVPSNPGVQTGIGSVGNPAMQRTRINLAATSAGISIGASGNADLRAQGNQQRLKIEMEANVPDGTMITVFANGTPIGTITIQLGEGEFEFESDSSRALTGGLLPSAITSLALLDASGQIVLQAQFGAIANNNPGLPPVLAIHKDVTLVATALGNSVNSEGKADLRSSGTEARLKVEVEAAVPDGTVWTVFANGNVKLGNVAFQLREAELELDGAALLQLGLMDGSSVISIQVTDAGTNEVLAGTF